MWHKYSRILNLAQVFKNRLSRIYELEPFKNAKTPSPFKFFKGCILQILLGLKY